MTDLLDLPAALERWGLTVVPVTGWEDRRRPGQFDPIGVLIHHTAAPARSKDAPSLPVCIDGRADLPGPLCQLLVARSGKVYVISRGRCNHAGQGALAMIPTDRGNTYLVGIEAENDGVGEPWPAVQVGAMVRATAAVLDLLGQPRTHVWAHREYTPRKIDPAGIPMAQFRADVAAARPPGATTVPTPTTENPYAAETREALQLLAQHSSYRGKLDPPWFGPQALQALHGLKNHAQALADANKTSAETIVRLGAERDFNATAAKTVEAQLAAAMARLDHVESMREAAEAEVVKLRAEIHQGGRLPAIIAGIEALLAQARA